MSREKLLGLLFLFAFIFSGSSQEIKFGNYDVKLRYLKGEYNNSVKISEKIEGSPFLDENFLLGHLYFDEKEPITLPLRYNIVNEEIQVRVDGDIYVIEDDVRFQLQEDHYQIFTYKEKETSSLKKGFFKVLSPVKEGKIVNDKKVVVLHKPVKKVRPGQEAAAMKTPSPGKYLDRFYYYLKFPQQDFAVATEKSKKQFVLAFPEEHRDNISRYIKENKLKPQELEDLKKIVVYYNSIY